MFDLHAIPDDFNLTANGDTGRGELMDFRSGPFYLTDPQGNKLTDPHGNYLTGYLAESVNPQQLHALPDDFELTAE